MEDVHASDCAVHNAPAFEPGPCDCGADVGVDKRILKKARDHIARVLQEAELAGRDTPWLRDYSQQAIMALDVFLRFRPAKMVGGLNRENVDE